MQLNADVLFDRTLGRVPYGACEEYYDDMRLYLLTRVTAYYFSASQWREGQHHLRSRVMHRDDIERLLPEALHLSVAAENNDNLSTAYTVMADQFYAHIKTRAKESGAAGLVLPTEYLFAQFELSELEENIAWLALAPEMDNQFEQIYGLLQGDGRPSLLTFDLAVRLIVCEPDMAFSALRLLKEKQSPLLHYFFTGMEEWNRSFLSMPLKPEKRMVDFILNPYAPNEPLSGTRLYQPDSSLPPCVADEDAAARMLRFSASLADDTNTLFFLYGPPGAGKKFHVQIFAKACGQRVLFVDLKRIDASHAPTLKQIRLECVLQSAIPCFTGFESVLDTDTDAGAYADELLKTVSAKTVFLLSEQEWKPRTEPAHYAFISIGLRVPNNITRTRIWAVFSQDYPLDSRVDLAETANKFLFTPGQIRRSLEAAQRIAHWNGHSVITREDLTNGCYGQIVHKLYERAVKVDGRFGWDDLVLPEAQKSLLKLACDQIRHRHVVYNQWGFDAKLSYGRSLSLLFSGPPGTGKTMAAQVMGRALNLEIYKIDLSSIVSKYIGDTQKNIKEVFDEARKSQSVLFFDEADALFGKRTEVKDSHDRAANMDTAFLLQKIEEYDGIVILATNLLQNFDEAFKRRLKFIVDFPFPDAFYRKKLWQTILPPAAPVSDTVDFDFLAEKFEFTGSVIKNVIVNAAFMAASEQAEIGMRQIFVAIKNEYAKGGTALLKEDLGEYYYLYASLTP